MAANRWLDRTQPQTLQNANILLYIDAVLDIIFGAFLNPIYLIVIIASVAGGYGIANEKKWGYWLGLSAAVLQLLLVLAFFSLGAIITLLFYAALVALLLHPQSREYRKTWFR